MDRLRRAFASRRRRWAAAAVGAAVLVAGGAAVWVAQADEVVPLRPMGGGEGLATRRDVPFATYALGDLCSRTERAVELVQVEAIRATGGATVTDFSVEPFKEGGPMIDKSRLRDAPDRGIGRTVEARCSQDDFGKSTLAVEVHRPGRPDALVEGLRLWYRDGERVRSVDDPYFTLGICPSTWDTDRSCLD